MKVPTKAELMHLRLQAVLRENTFADNQMKYLGMKEGKHWYLVGGKHKVSADQFEDFEMVD